MTNGDQPPGPPYVNLLIGIAIVILGAAAIRWRDWLQINTNPFRKTPEVTEEERDSLTYKVSAFVAPGLVMLLGAVTAIAALRHV